MNAHPARRLDPRLANKALLAILLLGAALRLIGLTAPVADDQSWNQVSTATVIRHFVEDGLDFFHPRWDVLERGDPGPRIEAEEAPIYHLPAVALAHLFGAIAPAARLVSIAFGTLAGLYLFFLMRRKTDELTALVAVVFFTLAPYPFFFFRTIMSDSAMVFAIVAALYYFDRYCESEKAADLLLAGVMTALAGLFKPFALHVGVPILIMAARRFGWGMFARPGLYLYALVALAPPLMWVAWAAKIGTLGGVTDDKAVAAAPHLWGRLSLLWDPTWYYRLQWRLFDRMATPVVTAGVLAAVIFKDARKKTGFFFLWLAGVAVYIGLVRSGNEGHNYYQLPAAAPFAALAAIGLVGALDRLPERLFTKVLAAVMALFAVLAFVYVLPHYAQDLSGEKAGHLAARFTAPGDKILVMDPGVTRKNQVIWAAHREGWHFQNLKPGLLPEYKELGATAVVLVLEPTQMEKSAALRAHLAAHNELLATRTGPFGKRGMTHTIWVYRLETTK